MWKLIKKNYWKNSKNENFKNRAINELCLTFKLSLIGNLEKV